MDQLNSAILLIDDQKERLEQLAEKARDTIPEAKIRTWRPDSEHELHKVFKQKSEGATIVVTDLDLTTGVRGFFGHSVVAWARQFCIPVGNFSRKFRDALPKKPDQFELRVPPNDEQAVRYIKKVFDGFRQIRQFIEQQPELVENDRSAAQVLADLLSRDHLEYALGPFFSKPSLFNSALLDTVSESQSEQNIEPEEMKVRLLTYIIGHVLLNAILKYPGPILDEQSLCAYVYASNEEAANLSPLFKSAKYKGPFDYEENLFWREDVDQLIDEWANSHGVEYSDSDSFGDFHRSVIEQKLQRHLAKHKCTRCSGIKGGFWCPFTERAVCERPDCSSTSSSWIPMGADVCRVERNFFEEWTPILGL